MDIAAQNDLYMAGNTTTQSDPLSSFISLALWILILVSMWKVFQKAGKPGWAAIIPLYNVYVLLQIIKKPWWWLLLMFIPFVNIVIWIMAALELGKVFGKGGAFSFFLIGLLPFIGYPILAFSDATYKG